MKLQGAVFTLALCSLACSARGTEPHTAGRAAPVVIVISLDGVRHDYPDRIDAPAFARMASDGLRAGRLMPVAPASTFPSHVSLATGAPAQVHGIIDNQFWDPVRGLFDYSNDASWIEAEPLWAAAERQGVPAATFFWVGSETGWRGTAARYRRAPFDSKIGEAEKVEQILAWLDLPAASRPRLLMSWWHGADRAGHRRGPEHRGVDAALTQQAGQLADLLAGLDARSAWPHTTLLVVSDHGMSTAPKSIPLRARLDAAELEPRLVTGSAVSHLFFDSPAEIARAEAALAGLEGLLLDRREALPVEVGLAHPTRSGDLVARALPGFTFRSRRFSDAARRILGAERGVHGYAVPHPDMPGIFLALGRCVERGAHPDSVHSLDLAATAAALLEIDPPEHSQGKPIEGLLRGQCATPPRAAVREPVTRFASAATGT